MSREEDSATAGESMARVPEGVDREALMVASRRVLLDVLDALVDQRDALVLVGAQAVYLRTHDLDLRVAAFTADGDLGIDRSRLKGDPHLDVAMEAAGFTRTPNQPGIWTTPQLIDGEEVSVEVDLLVAETFGFGRKGGRAARIKPHDDMAIRQVPGLEAATIDNDLLVISSSEPDVDPRATELRVAGVAALLVAKAYKIRDRLAKPVAGREADKDAGDVVRLMVASDVDAVAARLQELLSHPEVGAVTAEGLSALRGQFGAARTDGTNMAVEALAGGSLPESTIRAVGPAFAAALPTP